MNSGHESAKLAQGRFCIGDFGPYMLGRIIGRLGKFLEQALSPVSLTPVLWIVPAILHERAQPFNALSVYTVIVQSTLSRTDDCVEKQRLIEKLGEDDDGGVVVIRNASQGDQIPEGILPIAQSQWDGAIQYLLPREVD